jgi:hypothetical protein
LPHTTPENGAARNRKRKTEEKTPQKSPPKVGRSIVFELPCVLKSCFWCNRFVFSSVDSFIQAARITNWFSRQNALSSHRDSNAAEPDTSVKTLDAFVQTDDDASRAAIAGIQPARSIYK